MQATEALKLLLGLEPAKGVLLVDLLGPSMQRLDLPRRPDCPVCGVGAEPLEGLTADPHEVRTWHPDDYLAIDVREADEVAARPSGLRHIPTSAWTMPEADRPLLLVCASGVRSLRLARELTAAGIPAFSLVGGIGTLGARE
ncbi:hypothetical protein EON77_05800 [bacterium]|nr:MAG: hypothetical protein EON77_05800 [bacterium]